MVHLQIVIYGTNADLLTKYPTRLPNGLYNITLTEVSYYQAGGTTTALILLKSDTLRGKYGNLVNISFGAETNNTNRTSIKQYHRTFKTVEVGNYIDIELVYKNGNPLLFGGSDFCILGFDVETVDVEENNII